MMSTLLVQVYISSWTDVPDVDWASVTRKLAVAEAVFRLPDATVQNRLELQQGREVRITMQEGSDVVRFAGYIEKAKVKALAPGHFNMEAMCVGLEYGATLSVVWNDMYPDKLNPEQNASFQPGASGKDAMISSLNAATNYGTSAELWVRGAEEPGPDPANDIWRSLIEFTLAGMPANARIEDATLSLALVPGYGHKGTEQKFEVHAITESWDENTVLWATRPAYESAVQSTAKVKDDIGSLYTWDVTALVQRWIDGSLANNGLMLVNAQEYGNVADNEKVFVSSDDVAFSRPKLEITYVEPLKYTDAIKDLWNTYWPAVDTTQVVNDAKDFGQKEYFQYRNLAWATERLLEMLEGYHWWVEWDGSSYVLRCEPRGYTDPAVTLQEADIEYSFEMEPTNTDVRNTVYVVGGVGGGDTPGVSVDPSSINALLPIRGIAVDGDSQIKFGVRYKIIRDMKSDTREKATQRAENEVFDCAWEYFRVVFAVRNFALKPGDKVTLDLPTIGVDGVNFSDQYAVIKTEDTYQRGGLGRKITLSEKEHSS